MVYYCKAERQSRVKAYAGAPDQKSNAPSRGIRFCRTTESGLCMSRVSDYKNSTIYKEVSTYTAPLLKKCLLT